MTHTTPSTRPKQVAFGILFTFTERLHNLWGLHLALNCHFYNSLSLYIICILVSKDYHPHVKKNLANAQTYSC